MKQFRTYDVDSLPACINQNLSKESDFHKIVKYR